jgi:Ca2+:H+ antiporter
MHPVCKHRQVIGFVLGLGPAHIVLLVLTFVVTMLSVMPRRATLPQSGVHLALLAAYLFLSLT